MLVRYRDFNALSLCDEGREFLRSAFAGNEDTILSTREICDELCAERGVHGAVEALLDFVASVRNLMAWVFIARKAIDYVERHLPQEVRSDLRIYTSRVLDLNFAEAQQSAFEFSEAFISECEKAGVPENVLRDVFYMIVFYGERALRDALAMAERKERV